MSVPRPDLAALRQALDDDTLPVELRGQLADLIAAFQGEQDVAAGPHKRWYHASPHALPPGTVLTPARHRDVDATSQDFYDAGTHHIGDTLMGTTTDRTTVVWVTPSLADVRFWSRFLNADHVYEVQPAEPPQPWNGTGSDGWAVTTATIIAEIDPRGQP